MPPLFEETRGQWRLVLLDRYSIRGGRILAPAAIEETAGWRVVTVRLPLRLVALAPEAGSLVRGRILHARPEFEDERRLRLGEFVEVDELSRLPPVPED